MPEIIIKREEQEDLKRLLASYLPEAVRPFVLGLDLEGAEIRGKVLGVKVVLRLEAEEG